MELPPIESLGHGDRFHWRERDASGFDLEGSVLVEHAQSVAAGGVQTLGHVRVEETKADVLAEEIAGSFDRAESSQRRFRPPDRLDRILPVVADSRVQVCDPLSCLWQFLRR